MFAALVGASTNGRHADQSARAAASQANAATGRTVQLYALHHPSAAARRLARQVDARLSAPAAGAARRSHGLKSDLSHWSLIGLLGLLGILAAAALLSRTLSRTV